MTWTAFLFVTVFTASLHGKEPIVQQMVTVPGLASLEECEKLSKSLNSARYNCIPYQVAVPTRREAPTGCGYGDDGPNDPFGGCIDPALSDQER